MDPIIFTDTSVKLDETTIKENNIFIINNEKSNLGQIIYTLDLMSNSGKNIIYLSSKNNFSKLISFCDKITELHAKNSILLIEANNKIFSLLKSKNIIEDLKENNLTYHLSYNENNINIINYNVL